MNKVGLVLEGGALRGLYTAGVLDVMMENNISVDGIIGVSAGALFGANYFSKQKGRVIRYSKRFCKSRRYMSFWSLLFTGNLVNKDFAFYKVSKELDVFDDETFIKNNTGYYVVATNVENGKAEYLKVNSCLDDMEMLRASSAMPMVSKFVKIKNRKYLDGGISDSIPLEKCRKLGYKKIIVVLTQPYNYRKDCLSEGTIRKLHWRFRKYPKLVKTMIKRPRKYNNIVEKIINMERRKEIFVIRPSKKIKINILERNEDKLQAVYDLGVNDCRRIINEMKDYLI